MISVSGVSFHFTAARKLILLTLPIDPNDNITTIQQEEDD